MSYVFKSTEIVLPSYMKPVEEGIKEKLREKRARAIASRYEIIRFKGGSLFRVQDERQWEAMRSDDFARAAYRSCGAGISSTQIRDLEHLFRTEAPDYTNRSHLVAMGETVWDMRKAKFDHKFGPEDCIYQCPYEPGDATSGAEKFLLDLADGRPELADDMVQALAPLLLTNRPSGVIWFWGNGANGKSSLIDAVYRLFGPHLVSLTISHIEDGRDTPIMNGALGNIVRESSETKVQDAERYKALGTHEPFYVHKFHSQDTIKVTGDLHHVFNANNIPNFSDKSGGARRRTEIIPFDNTFKEDIYFNDRTFSSEFLAGLLTLITTASQKIQKRGGRYIFSKYTLEAKKGYDEESNTAEAYMQHLKGEGVEAFTNYIQLRQAYEHWCALNGDIALGLTNMKRAAKVVGGVGKRTSFRHEGVLYHWYVFKWSKGDLKDLISLDNGFHVGLKTKTPPIQIVFDASKSW